MGWELIKQIDFSGLPDARNWAFICGVGRTESSFLQEVLDAHPQITLTMESAIPYSLCYTMLSMATKLYDSGPSVKPINGLLRAPLPRVLCEAYRATVAPQAVIFGDKLWAYGNDCEALAKIFPHSTFLLTVREAKTWLASYAKFNQTIYSLDDIKTDAVSLFRARYENYHKVVNLKNVNVYIVDFDRDLCDAKRLGALLRRLCALWELDVPTDWLEASMQRSAYCGEGRAYAQTDEFKRFWAELWESNAQLNEYLLPCDRREI